MDLFGSEVSTNAANYFTNGLKGRWMETRRKDDHVLAGLTMQVGGVKDGRFVHEEVPMLNALNLDLRNEYAIDCARGIKRWNGALEKAGVEFRLTLPHEGFNRRVGAYAGSSVTPDGRIVDAADWAASADDWLPTADDRARVAALMVPEYEPGRFAGWIAPPAVGINEMPVEFDYVHF
jgi:benzoyl-CoA 2,3-dioxygenase component B